MPHRPLISKIRCHNPNKNKSRVCNRNYLIYIGTREGVDLTDTSLDKRISDSVSAMENLTDEYLTPEAANEVYVKYIAERPRSHGLFGSENVDVTDITQLGNELADLTKSGTCIYRGIVSLHEIDAMELGYDKKENWETFMRNTMPDIAGQFKIPIDKLAWTAAVHAEKGHPHVHFMFWRTDNAIQNPYIHESKQHKCREIFSKTMFEAERQQEVINKTLARDSIIDLGKNLMQDITPEIRIPGKLNNGMLIDLSNQMQELIANLPTKGRINYQLVSAELKTKVDELSSTLLSHPEIKREYRKYLDSVASISDTYSASSVKKEYTINNAKFDIKKRLGNIILSTAKELRKGLLEIDKQNHDQEFKELLKEQQLASGCYKVFRSAFSSILRQNNMQQDTSEFRSKSKDAMKDLARKQGKSLHNENPSEQS